MPDEVIQSRQNPRVQALARLRDRAEREARGLFIAEGLRELSRAIERKVEVLEIYFCPSMFRGSEAAELVTNARVAGVDCCELGVSAFEKVSGREGPGRAPRRRQDLELLPRRAQAFGQPAPARRRIGREAR